MAFKTFTPGATLTASEVNTYLAKQSVIVCTSTTRPSSPPEGMTIYETDTDKLLTYTTATTGWQPPWNMPWGYIGAVSLAANSPAVSAIADVAGLSLTWTAVANRRYVVRFDSDIVVNNSGNQMGVYLTNGAGTGFRRSLFTSPAASAYGTVGMAALLSGLGSGSQTAKIRIECTGGGTALTVASPTFPSVLIVEDIGPSGAPA